MIKFYIGLVLLLCRTLLCVCVVGCSCLYEGEQEGPDDPYYGGASKKDSGASNGPTYQVSGNM